jgi:hypothetical protein
MLLLALWLIFHHLHHSCLVATLVYYFLHTAQLRKDLFVCPEAVYRTLGSLSDVTLIYSAAIAVKIGYPADL